MSPRWSVSAFAHVSLTVHVVLISLKWMLYGLYALLSASSWPEGMSLVMASFMSALATMWNTASMLMGSSRATRAARDVCEPDFLSPCSSWIVFMKSAPAWAVLVPQSKAPGLWGSTAAARRPSEARRMCLSIGTRLGLGFARNVQRIAEGICGNCCWLNE
jgi:hypothetical protein